MGPWPGFSQKNPIPERGGRPGTSPLQRFNGQLRVWQVIRVNAADDQRAQVAVRGGMEDRGGVAARVRRDRARLQAPGLLDLGACGRVGDEPAAGQEGRQGPDLGRAPVAGPARDPRDLGAGGVRQPDQGREQAGDLGGTFALLLAKPQLRISEGQKAQLIIGDRVPIPTTTFNTGTTVGGNIVPITSLLREDCT